MSIVLLTSIMITTIVYSAFSTQLQISGEAIIRSDNDIRITNVKVIEQTNGSYETYNNKYTKDTTSMFVTLPSNSSITYEIEITNKDIILYELNKIFEESNINSNIKYEIVNINVEDVIKKKSTKVFNIKLSNNTNVEQKGYLLLKYNFMEHTPNSMDCDDETIICINNVEDIIKLRDEVNNGDSKSGILYFLTTDLDLGGKFDNNCNMLENSTNWISIGNENNPFSGVFNGDGHIIKNLYINTDTRYNALFGYLNNGHIKEIGIESSCVINTQYGASLLAGFLKNSTMDSCYSNGKVIGQSTSAGLISESNSSIIQNCYNLSSISSSSKQFAGGIIGYPSSSTIRNCYNSGNIYDSGREAGGIIGGSQSYVINTYNLGSINATYNCGGIVGQLYGRGIENSYNFGTFSCITNGGIVGNIYTNRSQYLKNNFYLDTTSEYGINASSNDDYEAHSNNNALPLSSDEMPSVISVINGDNAFVKDTNNINNGYPILKWELNR